MSLPVANGRFPADYTANRDCGTKEAGATARSPVAVARSPVANGRFSPAVAAIRDCGAKEGGPRVAGCADAVGIARRAGRRATPTASVLARVLLEHRRRAGRELLGVVRARLILPRTLGARSDRRAQVLGRIAKRINEVERVRAKPQAEPVNVRRNRGGALHREATVDQIPGEVLLDDGQAKEVA